MTATKKGSYFIHLFPIDMLDLSLFSLVSFKSFYFREFWEGVGIEDHIFLIDNGKRGYSILVYVETNKPIPIERPHTISYMGQTINSLIVSHGSKRSALVIIAQARLFKVGNKNYGTSIFYFNYTYFRNRISHHLTPPYNSPFLFNIRMVNVSIIQFCK